MARQSMIVMGPARFEGVSVRVLARELGIGPSDLVRRVRRLFKEKPGLREELGLRQNEKIGSRAYIHPGKRAQLHRNIAEALREGRIR